MCQTDLSLWNSAFSWKPFTAALQFCRYDRCRKRDRRRCFSRCRFDGFFEFLSAWIRDRSFPRRIDSRFAILWSTRSTIDPSIDHNVFFSLFWIFDHNYFFSFFRDRMAVALDPDARRSNGQRQALHPDHLRLYECFDVL